MPSSSQIHLRLHFSQEKKKLLKRIQIKWTDYYKVFFFVSLHFVISFNKNEKKKKIFFNRIENIVFFFSVNNKKNFTKLFFEFFLSFWCVYHYHCYYHFNFIPKNIRIHFFYLFVCYCCCSYFILCYLFCNFSSSCCCCCCSC